MVVRAQADGATAPPRPTMKAASPFVALAFLGVLSVFLPPYRDRGAEPMVMVAAFVGVLVLLAVSIRRDHRSWVDPAARRGLFPTIAF